MSELPVSFPQARKVLEGVATRQQMYALFNRHGQAPFDAERISGRRYAGEWFEVSECDHDRMFEILPPLFLRGDMFAMREFVADAITSVFFSLHINGRPHWFHGYCDLAPDRPCQNTPEAMRVAIIEREIRAEQIMTRQEKLDHIWSTTGADFRAYADDRFPVDFRGCQIVLVYSAAAGKVWKRLDALSDVEIAAKLPVQLRQTAAAA